MRKAFTLIELLVVMAGMSLLFSFGFANYRDFMQRKQLDVLARKIRADLRQAQGKAVAGEKPVGCATLDGYRVRWLSGTAYLVEAVCTNSVYTAKTVEIGGEFPNLQINTFPDIFFYVLSEGANADINISVNNTDTGENRQVSVMASGEIK